MHPGLSPPSEATPTITVIIVVRALGGVWVLVVVVGVAVVEVVGEAAISYPHSSFLSTMRTKKRKPRTQTQTQTQT
jgi:hypothetical protein